MTLTERPILQLPDNRRKVLLHSCCAPCSGEVMEAMTASGIEYAIYFYNPNIHPDREYEIRKNENIRFAEQHGIEFIDFFFSSRRRHTRSVSAFLLNRSSDLATPSRWTPLALSVFLHCVVALLLTLL